MCIGIPMQVMEVEPGHAWCEGMGQRRQVDTSLIGEQLVGTWVLVFLDHAREVLDDEQARRIGNALRAVAAVMQGESIDCLFDDLMEGEPQLPDFLRSGSSG